MQWSHVKTFEFVCYCLTFFLFLFLRDKFWCFYHFLWAFWVKGNVVFMEIYTNEKLNPFSNKLCNFNNSFNINNNSIILHFHEFKNFDVFWKNQKKWFITIEDILGKNEWTNFWSMILSNVKKSLQEKNREHTQIKINNFSTNSV